MKDEIFYCPDCLEYKGSWMGLSSHLRGKCKRPKKIKRNQLIFSIIKTKQFLDEVPSIKQMNNKGPVSERPIIDCFGTYNNALLESGFSPKNPKGVSEEKLINELKRVSQKHCDNMTPKVKDVQEYSIFSHKIFTDRYGSWNMAVKKAGFTPNLEKNISNKQLISEIKRVSEEYCDGRLPKSQDIREYAKYSLSTFQRTFGGWNNSLKKAGFEVKEHGSWVAKGKNAPRYGIRGKEHPSWKGGYDEYYGSSWPSQQKKALVRDNYRCQCCLKTERNIGRKPDVHHINPVRNWNVKREHEQMNNLNNLVSLCRNCHIKLEGRWKKKSSIDFISKARNL